MNLSLWVWVQNFQFGLLAGVCGLTDQVIQPRTRTFNTFSYGLNWHAGTVVLWDGTGYSSPYTKPHSVLIQYMVYAKAVCYALPSSILIGGAMHWYLPVTMSQVHSGFFSPHQFVSHRLTPGMFLGSNSIVLSDSTHGEVHNPEG